MKRGQLQHMFTFMLVTMVIMTTLFLGATLISKVLDKECDAKEKLLVRELQRSFTSHDTYGTRMVVELPTTCDSDAICFVPSSTTADEVRTATATNISEEEQIQLYAAKKAKVEENVFVVGDGLVKEILFEPKIETTGPFICIPSSGSTFYVKMTGKGKTILLSGAD